ncbi:hypothetical protein [uncultured Polaribacter sp.]|uniref:hypothetical protein n=1 Tax=uncultured Polaribacter sp. TaxID=174711 RepID=UPI00259B3741|nr:hypothetical protein [uncultured Polaribacter sp.]
MKVKTLLYLCITSFLMFSCAEDNDVTVPRNLQEYINTSFNNNEFGEVIACAASANANTNLAYIFYYPVEGASDFRYYEADSLNVDPNVFSNYRRNSLAIEDVFGGKLQRFSRPGATENWCLVTYVVNGKLHKSNPIRLKNTSKTTSWTDKVTIDYTTSIEPKFTWTDNAVGDNDIYFQVISETEENTFLSGTYTKENTFQYYNTANVVLNINEDKTPPALEIDKEYQFTMMDVSSDNWVNLVIEEKFIPGNLQEFLDKNDVDTSQKITAFASSANGNQNLSYIYYYPLTNARDFRYYETEGTSVNKDDFSNYRRKILTDATAFGTKLRRFSRTDDEESWCIVTYEIDKKIYTSNPIRIKNVTQPTQYEKEVDINQNESLKPTFTWTDFGITNNALYFQVITDNTNAFVSGIFTKEKTFTYYNTTNTVSNINTETPPDLVLNDEYKFTLLGISSENWVNLVIEDTFEVE